MKVVKQEDPAPKKVAKSEEKKTAGAKSKLLIEDVDSEAVKPAPVAEPKIAAPEPVKLVEKVQELAKEEQVVQKAEEVKPVEGQLAYCITFL